MTDLFNTLEQLVVVLGRLVTDLGSLALHWWVVLLWLAWWLWGVNWQKAWPVLARGAWVALVLIIVVAALVWSRIAPSSGTILGVVVLPNFWWQLCATAALAGSALFCGWIQGLMSWTPTDVDLAPVEHGHGHH